MPRPYSTPYPLYSSPYILDPTGHALDAWKAIKASVKAGSRVATLAFIGDSITQGANSSATISTSYPAKLRAALLAAGFPAYGDFYAGNFEPSFGAITGSGLPWAKQANGLTASVSGNGFSSIIYNNAAQAFGTTGDIIYTSPYACTAIDLIFWDTGTAGSFQYNVDNSSGTALTTVTINGWSNNQYRLSLAGLSNQVHTVRLGNVSGISLMQCNGAISYTGSSGGLLFAFTGTNGVSSSNFSSVAPQWQGQYKSSSSVTVKTGFGYPTAPDLALIALGVNDMQNAAAGQAAATAAADTLLNNLSILIKGIRRGNPSATIVLLLAAAPDSASSDATSFFTNSTWWELYLDRMISLAFSLNCLLANAHAAFTETPVANGYMAAGNPHPNDGGYALISNLLAAQGVLA